MSRITELLRALLTPLGPGARALLLRLINRFGWKAVAVGAVVLVYACARYRTWTVWILAVLAAAAWMHAPDPETTATKDEPGAGEEQPSPPDTEAVRRLLLDVMGDSHGVHLRTVLEYLQKHGQWEGKTVADLRQHVEALGIPVQPKVKVGGIPTRGVLRADLEALSPLEETRPSPGGSLPV